MTTFTYKAKKDSAETVTGQIKAHNQEEAIDLINQLGLLPVSVTAQSQGEGSTDPGKPRKVKSKELYIFSRQLANLLKSGVSLLKALHIIEEQTYSSYFKKVIANISWEVKNGNSFSESLAHFPNIFSSLYITMISAGEESGSLQEMLVSVAIHQRKQGELSSKVRTALAYPLLMAFVGMATVYFILTFVLPKMSTLFENIAEGLPLPTIILLNISHALSHYWLWILLGVLFLTFITQRWIRSAKGRFTSSRFLLHMPLFGEIVLKSELARFSRTLFLLLHNGVSIVRALQVSIPILSNELVKSHLTKCQEDLTAGGSFGQSLKESSELPAMMGHLIAVGEESGHLNEVLLELAETYEQETNEKIKIMTTLLEPMMILLIGLVIGFIVFAMLLPIFQVDVLPR